MFFVCLFFCKPVSRDLEVEHLKWWLQSVDIQNGRSLIPLIIKYSPHTYIEEEEEEFY